MRNRTLLLTGVVLLASVVAAFAIGGGDLTFNLQNADPVQFSHDFHAKARGLKCAACHFQKFSKGSGYEMKKERITKRDFCEHCHNGMKSFDAASPKNCARCHRK